VAAPKFAALTAGWFWSTHNCNALAEAADWTSLTRKIIGGTIGLNDRVVLANQAMAVLSWVRAASAPQFLSRNPAIFSVGGFFIWASCSRHVASGAGFCTG
jgi:hypothetical protein